MVLIEGSTTSEEAFWKTDGAFKKSIKLSVCVGGKGRMLDDWNHRNPAQQRIAWCPDLSHVLDTLHINPKYFLVVFLWIPGFMLCRLRTDYTWWCSELYQEFSTIWKITWPTPAVTAVEFTASAPSQLACLAVMFTKISCLYANTLMQLFLHMSNIEKQWAQHAFDYCLTSFKCKRLIILISGVNIWLLY